MFEDRGFLFLFFSIKTMLYRIRLLHRQMTGIRKGSGGLMVKVFVSQPRDNGLEAHMVHDHDPSCDTSIGLFHKAD